MYLIHPTKSFGTIGEVNVTNGQKEDVTSEFKIELKNHYTAIFINGKQRMEIRESLYNEAIKNGDLIKMDFNKSRARRIGSDVAYAVIAESVAIQKAKDFDPTTIDIATTKLKDITFNPKLFQPIKTGTYLDKFFSHKGGILPGTNTMVTGDPGIGKSSNLMDILVNVVQTNPNRKVLYISAEMSEIDVKEFEKYYPGIEDIHFLYLNNYIINDELGIKPYQAIQSVLHQGWDLVVNDSLVEIMACVQEDLGLNGKEAEKWMLNLMGKHNSGNNKTNSYTSFLCIQQKNKSGQFVGSNRLIHMTTAFLQMNWSKSDTGKRFMMFEKNRKGQERVRLFYGFHETNGIVYDEKRHEKELEIFKRLQTQNNINIDEVDPEEFEKLFSKPAFEENIN